MLSPRGTVCGSRRNTWFSGHLALKNNSWSRLPGLLELDLYASDQTRYPVVEKSPEQAENETEYPIEDRQENYGPDAEQQPGEGIRSLRVSRS